MNSSNASYTIGTAINALEVDYSRRVRGNDSVQSSDYYAICNKHKVYFYFFSTSAYVCRADGILSEKEKKRIVTLAKAWLMPENEILEALKGKDYAKEMVNAARMATKEMIPNANDEQISQRIEPLKYALVMQSLVAAAQDGFVEKEYKISKELAKKLGFDDSTVDKMIDIIKLENLLYNQLSRVMKFKNNTLIRSKY